MASQDLAEPKAAANASHRSEADLIEAAVAASDAETLLPRKELFRMYWPAVMFSALLSLALVMEGMDTGMINNFFAHPAYLAKFGWPDADGKQHISAAWQGAIGAGNNIGSVFGLLINGYLQSRYGSRKVYMFAMALMGTCVFILFFSVNVQMIFAGNVICGLPWGMFQTLTTAYAAEITPASLRGYLTAWVSMCWGAGSFLAAGVLRASLNLEGDAGWRVPYALQWIWIPPLLVVGFLAPESPWYLVRRGRIDDAEKSLRRLARKGHYTEDSMAETLALMKHTNEMEKIESANSSYMDTFRGTNLRRTGIVIMAWVIQMLNGQSLTQFATVMLTAIGMPATQAFTYSMGIQSVNILATGIAISLMGKIGRRAFYLFGSGGIGVLMLAIGIMGFVAGTEVTKVAIPVAVVLIIVQATFKVSLGPTTYVIVGEVPSNRVRAQTIVLGRGVYVLCGLIVQQINPRMLNSTTGAWGWGAKTGMLYFGFCFFWVLWIWFFLPETKNRSFADIDYLFQKKVKAKDFPTTPIDLFEFAQADSTKEKLEYVEEVEQSEKRAH